MPADLILITHDHFDHFSPDGHRPRGRAADDAHRAGVGDRARSSGVTAVTLSAGETATVGGVTVTAVPAYNIDKFRRPGEVYHPRAAGGLGYIVELDGRRIYHAGDTDAIPEMGDVRCDVALLPVSGTYVMTAEEAAEACRMISATVVVPMHFGDIVGTAADAARFEAPLRDPRHGAAARAALNGVGARSADRRPDTFVEEGSMRVVRAVPTESISEQLSVQRLSEALGVRNLRVNVFTLAEGSMSKHMHREQEEVYLVLDGTAMIDVDEEQFKVGEREALAVPARAWHRVANVGYGPLTFFVAAAPAVDDDAEIAG